MAAVLALTGAGLVLGAALGAFLTDADLEVLDFEAVAFDLRFFLRGHSDLV